jgi:hypothetical protein
MKNFCLLLLPWKPTKEGKNKIQCQYHRSFACHAVKFTHKRVCRDFRGLAILQKGPKPQHTQLSGLQFLSEIVLFPKFLGSMCSMCGVLFPIMGGPCMVIVGDVVFASKWLTCSVTQKGAGSANVRNVREQQVNLFSEIWRLRMQMKTHHPSMCIVYGRYGYRVTGGTDLSYADTGSHKGTVVPLQPPAGRFVASYPLRVGICTALW